MTGQSMIDQFLVFYDRITNFSAASYERSEILVFLNSAMDEFIKDRMFGKNFQSPAFEDNQKRVADLRSIITTSGLTIVPGGPVQLYGELFYTLPTSNPVFLYYIESISSLIRSSYPVIGSVKYIKNKFITHEQATRFANNEMNKTHFLNPVTWIEGTTLCVLPDRFTTIANVRLTYVFKPTAIADNTNVPQLAEHTHQEIVDIAVRQALQAIQDPRFQTAIIESQQKTQ